MTSPAAPLEFRQAPLNEFVLGVQFAQPHGYQQIYAGEVWSLFKDRFPHVQELPAIPPAFETFGIPQSQQIDFGIVSGASHDRFWFMSPNKQELIQFQHDRLLRNWREISGQTSKYPRFEVLIDSFKSDLDHLNSYMKKFDPHGLSLNQCEVSYINHIKPDGDKPARPEDWLTFVDFKNLDPHNFNVGFRRTISHPDGRPLGRIYCEAATAFDSNGKPFIALTLTARGAPATPGLQGALEFLRESREKLGKLFVAVTTDSAQRTWGRV